MNYFKKQYQRIDDICKTKKGRTRMKIWGFSLIFIGAFFVYLGFFANGM